MSHVWRQKECMGVQTNEWLRLTQLAEQRRQRTRQQDMIEDKAKTYSQHLPCLYYKTTYWCLQQYVFPRLCYVRYSTTLLVRSIWQNVLHLTVSFWDRYYYPCFSSSEPSPTRCWAPSVNKQELDGSHCARYPRSGNESVTELERILASSYQSL